MKVTEMRALSREDLLKQLEAVHKELFDLRFRLTTKQLVNIREIRRAKKEIARLETIKKERDIR